MGQRPTYRGGLPTGECRGAKPLCLGSGVSPSFKFPQSFQGRRGIKGVEKRLIDNTTHFIRKYMYDLGEHKTSICYHVTIKLQKRKTNLVAREPKMNFN